MNYRTPLLLGALVAAVAAPARADETKRSDTLQTLGVGARAIGLGGAFVAVSEDVTAAFWNPAGLATLLKPQLALDYRTLSKSQQDVDDATQNVFGSKIGSTSMVFSFGGFAYPLPANQGTIAFARTLGGFEQVDTSATDASGAATLDQHEIARYWFNTLAYGREVKLFPKKAMGGSLLRLGLSASYVQLRGRTAFENHTLGTSGENSGSAGGVTFGFGGQLLLRGANDPLTLAFNYQNPTNISDDSRRGALASFGSKVPGRVSLGAAYRIKQSGTEGWLASVEGRHNFGADDRPTLFEDRSDTTNVHFGVEYNRIVGGNTYFLRSGFYTRNSSNDDLFFNDRLVTVGAGLNSGGRYLADVGVEVSTVTGDPLVITSFRYNFKR
jgi:hypothetical protein